MKKLLFELLYNQIAHELRNEEIIIISSDFSIKDLAIQQGLKITELSNDGDYYSVCA